MNDLITEIKLKSLSTILVSICKKNKKVTSLSHFIWQFYVYEVFEGRDPASSKAQYTEKQTFQLCRSVSSWMDMTVFVTFRTYYWRAVQIYPEWGKYLRLTSKMKSEWYWKSPKLTVVGKWAKIFLMVWETLFFNIFIQNSLVHCRSLCKRTKTRSDFVLVQEI